MGYIYKITNQINKKCYIGVTKKSNPYLRLNEYKRKIEKDIKYSVLKAAITKYGIANFTFEVIIICINTDLYKLEVECIKKYNSTYPYGYNF